MAAKSLKAFRLCRALPDGEDNIVVLAETLTSAKVLAERSTLKYGWSLVWEKPLSAGVLLQWVRT